MDNKKKIILSVLIVLLLLVVGVTYAFFTYESGTKSDIVTGQIYMNYEETSTISLTGVFPETKEQALSRLDENGVFEFTITGRNTSKYPVYYEIDLLEGGVMTGKTEQSTKILPEHVMIYLERDGEPLVDGMTYKDWNNRRIYVDTVPANQTSNIEHKYTLRMWIDENVTISDTNPDADYTTSEWNDAYTSLKVRVVGDFEYKDMSTDASCFAYNILVDQSSYDYSKIFLNTSEEKVNTCKAFLMNEWGSDYSDAQDGYQSYCEGTGTIENGIFLIQDLEDGYFTDEQMKLLGVVEKRYYELNTTEESVKLCKEYMLNDIFSGEDVSDAGDGYQSYCEGTGTEDGYTIIEDLNRGMPAMDYFIGNNILTQVETPQGEIEITNYDETCGTDVIIPSTIEGLPVTRIADAVNMIPTSYDDENSRNSTLENQKESYLIKSLATENNQSFISKGLTSVKLPETMKYIGENAFLINGLTEIIIPNSVIHIGKNAFKDNWLRNVEIGIGVKSIDVSAFGLNPLVEVNVKGNPSLGRNSFATASYKYNSTGGTFELFQYGGTCEELNQYNSFGNYPDTIITSDTNSCIYTGPVIPQ